MYFDFCLICVGFLIFVCFFFFKQKTAYEMRISDWSSDVCSSDLAALAGLDEALENSIVVHQRSDVPYGMFLSGGVDSATVLALMARLNDRPVRALTIGFSGTDAPDERNHARAVARTVGAEHVEVDSAEAAFWPPPPARPANPGE